MTDERKELGNRLREAREYLGLSQDEAAKAVKLTRPAISLIETGQRKVDALELKRFADLYQRPVAAFTGEMDASAAKPQRVAHLARAAAALSEADKEELLKFAEYLRWKAARKQEFRRQTPTEAGVEVPESFGQRVRRVREAKKLGLREAAAKLKISPAYLSRIERGDEKTPPAEDVIRAIAELCDDSFDELMHLAGRLPSDVKEYLKEPGLPQFLRTAQQRGYTARDLESLLKDKDKK